MYRTQLPMGLGNSHLTRSDERGKIETMIDNNNNNNLLFIHTLLNLNRNSKVWAVSSENNDS